MLFVSVFFQAEDGIRDLVRSRGLGDVYKRQQHYIQGIAATLIHSTKWASFHMLLQIRILIVRVNSEKFTSLFTCHHGCLLYTSDAADERSSVDLGGRRIIKKKKRRDTSTCVDRTKKKEITLSAQRLLYNTG